jgi:hypothetical protein
MSNRIKNLIYLVLYFILFSVTVAAFLKENWVAFFLALIIICAIFGLRFFFRRSSVIYPQEIEIALVLFVTLSFVLDEFMFVQENVLLFDVMKHIISGMLFGLIAFLLVYALNHFHKNSLRLNSFFVALFSFTFSIAFSFLWIIVEDIIEALVAGFSGAYDGYISSQLWTLGGVIVGALIVAMTGYQYLEHSADNIVGRVLNRFFAQNPSHKTGLTTTVEDAKRIIKKGENDSVEFKETLRKNLHTSKNDKRIEHAVLKTIVAFLNTNGGILFIGVSDDGEVKGFEQDEFKNFDKFQLHFTNIFNKYIGEHFAQLVQSQKVIIDKKQILRVDCFRSEAPVFLKDGQKEEFFIRVGAATQEIQGSKLLEYIQKNFS